MGYSIREALEDVKRKQEFYRLLMEHYPDAYLEGDEWVSRSLPTEECEGFTIHTDSRGTVYARLYKTLGEGRVYINSFNHPYLWLVLHEIQTKNPELYALVLDQLKAKVLR